MPKTVSHIQSFVLFIFSFSVIVVLHWASQWFAFTMQNNSCYAMISQKTYALMENLRPNQDLQVHCTHKEAHPYV